MPKTGPYVPPPLLDFVDTAKLDPSQVVFTTDRITTVPVPGRIDSSYKERNQKRRAGYEKQTQGPRQRGLRGALTARGDKPNGKVPR